MSDLFNAANRRNHGVAYRHTQVSEGVSKLRVLISRQTEVVGNLDIFQGVVHRLRFAVKQFGDGFGFGSCLYPIFLDMKLVLLNLVMSTWSSCFVSPRVWIVFALNQSGVIVFVKRVRLVGKILQIRCIDANVAITAIGPPYC